jgi:threonine dehydratase
MTGWRIPTFSDVLAARRRIAPYLRRTPLFAYAALNELIGTQVYIKHENHPPVGAFKVRGGVNLVAQLSGDESARGLIAASTGNHRQSVAFAARIFGVTARICVPRHCNPVKVAAMEGLGAHLIEGGDDFDEARENADRLAGEHGYRYVHSGNEPDLIAGVATDTLEILEEQPNVDVVIVPVGGGSGAAGACIAAKAVNPAAATSAASSCWRSWAEIRSTSSPRVTARSRFSTR